jgi:hypothetical protein
MEDGSQHVLGKDWGRGRCLGVGIGPADDLTHGQPTPGEGQRTQPGPVITACVLVDLGGTAKFARDDQQDLVAQATALDIVEEGSFPPVG